MCMFMTTPMPMGMCPTITKKDIFVMAKKRSLVVLLICFAFAPVIAAHATDLGLSAGALFPISNFEDAANSGFSVGYHVKRNVYQAFNYGFAINYGSAKGDHGVDFQEIDIYPFIDWIFYRNKRFYAFTRGGIGLFHWESDNIWYLDNQGNGMITTLGVGCNIMGRVELLANVTKLYADFDVDCVLVRLGYIFDIGE